jgi:LIVCS family branched-chain amino acid:cation transporter
MTTKKLTLRQKILVAGTLFGMFFGAGNLIFPVHLGQMAGRNALPAIIGFIITAVGIPILGVAAIGVTHSDGLQTLSGKVGKGYGIFFTCLLYLTIGPLFAIPRCATVSFTTGITPLLGADSPERLYLLLFSAVFFAFVLFFSLRPGKITVWIGKIINPLFLFFFAVLMLAALLAPGAAVSAVEPVEAYRSDAFFPALIEGYGTMDAIAGLAFGIVVIDVIRRMGVDNDDAIAKDVLSSGLLTGALMALIYVVSIVVGAQSRGLFELSENGGIALTQIAGHYLGGVGLFILAFTITFACLKTSIGLVTACAETFSKMTNGKISYRSWAILFTVFSFAVSNIGLSAIIEYSIPMLMLIYPPAIALILLAFLGKFFAHDRTVYIATMIGTWAAAIFDCMKTLPAPVQAALHLDAPIAFAAAHLPLFDKNLGWLLPAVIGFAAGMAIRASRRQTPAALS